MQRDGKQAAGVDVTAMDPPWCRMASLASRSVSDDTSFWLMAPSKVFDASRSFFSWSDFITMIATGSAQGIMQH